MNLIFEELNFNLSFNLLYVLGEIMMDCKDEQYSKALSPMLVTESEMVTECKDEHQLNASSPKLVTELWIVKR